MKRLRWQQVLRILLGLFAIAFATAVYMAIRERAPIRPADKSAPRTDPAAIAESTRGESLMARGSQQEFKIKYDRLLSYQDGSLRFEAVDVFVPDRNGRDFSIQGKRATVTNQQSDVTIEGDVRLTASDGLVVTSQSATYQNADGIVRIPGAVAFERGRLKGTGDGATYDRTRDVLWLLKDARVSVAVDPATGQGAVEVTSTAAGFARRDRYMRFDGGARLVRDQTVLEADNAVGYLAADEDRIELLELRGASRVTTTTTQPGGLEAMAARDINLAYAEDGRSLKQATLAGDGSLQLAGPAGQRGRRLSANWIDMVMAPDGTTVTTLSAREKVDLEIPGAGGDAPDRRIRSTALEGTGPAGQALSTVRFSENVEFREQRAAGAGRPAVDRLARSRTLDALMQPGLGGLERATFAGGVSFRNGDTDAQAPDAVYDLAKGTLALAGGTARASVSDPRVNVEARAIDVTLETNAMAADGDVRSLLKAGGPAEAADGTPRKRPGLLRNDQPVNVTARQLAYNSAAGTATYTGDARLWQGETAIQGATLTLDDKQGNLTATTAVRSTLRLDDTDPKTGKTERKTTIATAESLVYEEATHRATYTTNARLNGPEGDLRAAKIELYLKPEGGALDRLQAYEAVTLRSENRTSSGAQLTYFATDARYVMNGAPVRVLEQLPSECRETVGRILTFFRATDTILVDGNEQGRTQTTSGGKCPGAAG